MLVAMLICIRIRLRHIQVLMRVFCSSGGRISSYHEPIEYIWVVIRNRFQCRLFSNLFSLTFDTDIDKIFLRLCLVNGFSRNKLTTQILKDEFKVLIWRIFLVSTVTKVRTCICSQRSSPTSGRVDLGTKIYYRLLPSYSIYNETNNDLTVLKIRHFSLIKTRYFVALIMAWHFARTGTEITPRSSLLCARTRGTFQMYSSDLSVWMSIRIGGQLSRRKTYLLGRCQLNMNQFVA